MRDAAVDAGPSALVEPHMALTNVLDAIARSPSLLQDASPQPSPGGHLLQDAAPAPPSACRDGVEQGYTFELQRCGCSARYPAPETYALRAQQYLLAEVVR